MSGVLRVLVGSPATLQETFYGDETEASGGPSASVTVTKADGSVLVASGTADRVGSTGATYQYALAAVPTLELLTVTWTATINGASQTRTSTVEIVGGFHVALSELRALPNLDSTSKFTTAELRAARDWWEELAEDYCGQPFVRRYRRVRLSGQGRSSLLLPDAEVRSVRSVRTYTDGVTFTSFDASDLADIAVTSGVATRLTRGVWIAGTDNLVVEYEAGPDSCPVEIHDAALIAIRSKLLQDNTGRPMLSVATADGVVRFALPGPDRPTGYPDADSVLNRKRLIPVG